MLEPAEHQLARRFSLSIADVTNKAHETDACGENPLDHRFECVPAARFGRLVGCRVAAAKGYN